MLRESTYTIRVMDNYDAPTPEQQWIYGLQPGPSNRTWTAVSMSGQSQISRILFELVAK